MKLVFFGTPNFSIPTLDLLYKSDHEVLSVITSTDKRSGRGLNNNLPPIKLKALNLNLPVYQPVNLNDNAFISILKEMNPDIFIVVAFKILPKSILQIPKYGAINLHASLLPKYRGAAPVNHAILNGESQIGLTTFFIEEKVDTGKILLQELLNINDLITTGEALEKLSHIGAKLTLKTLDGLLNKTLSPRLQNNNNASIAPKIKIEDCKINWNNTAINIHNQIRAFSPNPGAYTFYNNKRVKLFGSKIIEEEDLNRIKPGYIHYKSPFIYIGTETNPITIKEIQIEGKKQILVKQFILGYPEIIGANFA